VVEASHAKGVASHVHAATAHQLPASRCDTQEVPLGTRSAQGQPGDAPALLPLPPSVGAPWRACTKGSEETSCRRAAAESVTGSGVAGCGWGTARGSASAQWPSKAEAEAGRAPRSKQQQQASSSASAAAIATCSSRVASMGRIQRPRADHTAFQNGRGPSPIPAAAASQRAAAAAMHGGDAGFVSH
jgi:hypothetical protein